MGFLDGTVEKISDVLDMARSKKKLEKHKQLETVEIKVKMDCEGCEKMVKDAVKGMEGVTQVVVEPKKHKLTVMGYVDPDKVLKRVLRKTEKRAEMWPYVPHTVVDHPYVPGVYDKKAPAGFVRNVDNVNSTASQLARASSTEELYVSAFSDDNPNACSLM